MRSAIAGPADGHLRATVWRSPRAHHRSASTQRAHDALGESNAARSGPVLRSCAAVLSFGYVQSLPLEFELRHLLSVRLTIGHCAYGADVDLRVPR